ncbi:hypothetical protein FBY10_107154 [Pseudomonas sp. SJZ103]|jgi:hypothetical protein|nr:hypothetical protein [Pseudomonas sp. BIGb0381]TWC67992.1 hypothetical protein FBY10_107154 [Pseudomonas sp. SJZ103]TWC84926.1 hypothetical protein FBY08_107154 [Pseudomonas sp. SJZ094]
MSQIASVALPSRSSTHDARLLAMASNKED